MSTKLLMNIAGDGGAPVACTLAPARFEGRIAQLAGLRDGALLAREPVAGGERLTFCDGEGVEAELRAAVEAEAACCAFLAMRLGRRDDGTLVLDVTGPAEARPLIAALFA